MNVVMNRFIISSAEVTCRHIVEMGKEYKMLHLPNPDLPEHQKRLNDLFNALPFQIILRS